MSTLDLARSQFGITTLSDVISRLELGAPEPVGAGTAGAAGTAGR